MSVTLFITVVALLGAVLLLIYLRSYRHQDENEFSPMAAWLRAGLFFCFCYLLSWATGTLEAMLAQPLFTA